MTAKIRAWVAGMWAAAWVSEFLAALEAQDPWMLPTLEWIADRASVVAVDLAREAGW